MFGQPMGAAPMQATPGGFDMQRALTELRMKPEEAKAYAEAAQFGTPKVARTVEVMRNGKPTLIQLDERGQEIGAGYDQWKAPLMQNLGGRTAAIDPVSLGERGSFAQTMSPEGRDASARGWATVGQGAQRLALEGQNAQAGKAPAGYRPKADGTGLEYIPGGPADPNAAKRAAPTEFQGKSATYGARAQEADKIITGLDGKYSPMAVNSKLAAGNVPLIGGALEASGNMLLSAEGQKAEQAQRDFVNAVLRQESGAAISQGEFENARKQYFPQPFDSDAVKKQKARNRQIAIQGFLANARPGAPAAITSAQPDDNDPLGLRK
jgi:hypothetical protein